MNITLLEIPAKDLLAQKDYYAGILELPVSLSVDRLTVQAGSSELIFTQAEPDFNGAYHFAFNIPENQFRASKEWIAARTSLLSDLDGKDEFPSESWNSHSVYFKDAAGNVLEFIARHNLKNAADGNFDGRRILNISEIGLPSEDVIGWASELCSNLGVSAFNQEPSESFTPVGDDHGLLILPVKDRIWMPNSGVPAKLLPIKATLDVDGRQWAIHGYPYEIAG